MARGVRKSPVEKMQGELADVQASIAQYESCLETMREKEKALMEHIQLEEFKVVNEMLKERDMTIDDLKEMLAGGDVTLSACYMKTCISGKLGNIRIGQPAGGMGFPRGTLWHTALGEVSVLCALPALP